MNNLLKKLVKDLKTYEKNNTFKKIGVEYYQYDKHKELEETIKVAHINRNEAYDFDIYITNCSQYPIEVDFVGGYSDGGLHNIPETLKVTDSYIIKVRDDKPELFFNNVINCINSINQKEVCMEKRLENIINLFFEVKDKKKQITEKYLMDLFKMKFGDEDGK